MLKFILLWFLLISASLKLQAQVNVKGKITDTSRIAISFANVSLRSIADSAVMKATQTDSIGVFELPGVQPGRYFFNISFIGYLPYSRQITIADNSKELNLADIALLPDPKQLKEVVISGERNAVRYEPQKMILQVAGNTTYKTAVNLMDVLRKAPGLTVDPDGTIQVSGRNAPTIFINGKPVIMSPQETLAYMNGLTPDMTESIEVITNPSSRYDGQYKAIIDIRLKVGQSGGLIGSLSSAFRQNMYSSADNNLNLSYRADKITYILRGGYVAGDDYYQYTALQQLASTNYMATKTYTRNHNNNFTLQLGAEYLINKNQGLEFSLKTYQANRSLGTFNTLIFSEPAGGVISGIRQTANISDPRQQNYTLNAAYNLHFAQKNTLNVFASASNVNNRQAEDIQIRNQLTDSLSNYWKTGLKNDIRIRTIQADYTLTGKNTTFEAGGKYAHVITDNDLRYDTLGAGNQFVPDAGRTNQFIYNEYISAAYLAYGFKTSKLDIRLSLRGEHTRTLANSVLQAEVLNRNYFTWLPAASVSYLIDEGQRLTLAFTRRMTRPDFDQLNPFRFYLSPLNYRVGNPNLRPSVTSSFNFTYTHSSFNISLAAGTEKDFMTRYPEYNRVTNELLYLGANIPYNNFASIESGYGFSVLRWWKISQNIGVYYNKQQMPYLGKTYAIGVTDYNLTGSQVFTLPKGFTTDLTYRYQLPGGNSLYTRKAMGSIDVGLQKSWLNGKLNTKLNMYDLFYTHAISLVFREKAIINNQFTHRFATRRVVLTMIFNFGKANYLTKKGRINEEENRVAR